jgi:hypothetical protein
VGEPGVELGEGGGIELVAVEGAFCVLVCLGIGRGVCGRDWIWTMLAGAGGLGRRAQGKAG